MYILMEVGKTRMQSIRFTASTISVAKPHDNKGRSNAIKEDDPRMPPLRSHFKELLGLGEVRATRFVAAWAEGNLEHTTRVDDDEQVYLLLSNGYRSCFSCYMKSISWPEKPDSKVRDASRLTRILSGMRKRKQGILTLTFKPMFDYGKGTLQDSR